MRRESSVSGSGGVSAFHAARTCVCSAEKPRSNSAAEASATTRRPPRRSSRSAEPCVELPLRRPRELRKLLGGEDGDGVTSRRCAASTSSRRLTSKWRRCEPIRHPAGVCASIAFCWCSNSRRSCSHGRRAAGAPSSAAAVALLAAIAVAALRHARHLAAQLIFKRQLLLKQHRHLVDKARARRRAIRRAHRRRVLEHQRPSVRDSGALGPVAVHGRRRAERPPAARRVDRRAAARAPPAAAASAPTLVAPQRRPRIGAVSKPAASALPRSRGAEAGRRDDGRCGDAAAAAAGWYVTRPSSPSPPAAALAAADGGRDGSEREIERGTAG